MSDLLARIKTHSLPRFLAVGVLNTLLSTVVMFVLYDAGHFKLCAEPPFYLSQRRTASDGGA